MYTIINRKMIQHVLRLQYASGIVPLICTLSVIGNVDRKDHDITKVGLGEIHLKNVQTLQLCLGTEYPHTTSPKSEQRDRGQQCWFGSCSSTCLHVLFDHSRENTEVASEEGIETPPPPLQGHLPLTGLAMVPSLAYSLHSNQLFHCHAHDLRGRM